MTNSNKEIRKTSSKFVRIRCPSCNHEQVIFGKASTPVKCLSCKKVLAKCSSGKVKVRAKVLEVLQ
ncbi:30S ribosomal protein S27e [Candidatus Pacearchaeota archaeon CG_4_9_14_3_um_filter_31_7]|nr:MAG: 30S ribosomal protein S27e [Candidatus Pacearchaeota archaeon CG1_02_31_27]PIN92296.1 MAG: 30S ribosomal protein S27e [Candidatus Pacearchaeota archaeon CG10_big_fil_rev_8_21_14_0_10_31_59]PIZ81145.1 MAG: 30S ribosomal protein S27e [Candidatus Pacearchaeota archaeon CG_4_10_14_0_2_um_filter_31_10]PJA70977.1 MAG: 30S ribosomal protein S27e [Candidatus Pacearchaeota archaeon CG_4_9_14_3_um_filter_31_7]